MIIETIAESTFGLIIRALGWIFLEVLFEIIARSIGYVLCRVFKTVKFSDSICPIVGLITMGLIIVLGLIFYFNA